MRDLSPAIVSAIQSAGGVKQSIDLIIYKNRNFFVNGDVNDCSPAFIDDAGIPDNPLSQDFRLYDDFRSKPVGGGGYIFEAVPLTACCYENVLYGGVEGYNLVRLSTSGSGGQSSDAESKLALYTSGSDAAIYFCDDDKIKKAIINTTTLETDTEADNGYSECISVSTFVDSFPYTCAIHALGEDDLGIFRIDDGGIRVEHIYLSSGSLCSDESPVRFMYPTKTYTEDDIGSLHYSAAVKTDTGYLFYFTMPNGSVHGMSINNDGYWSDMFEAIPSDLSRFAVTNAIVTPNNTIHLAGQFERTDPQSYFTSTLIYNLDLWSNDGLTFSLDRFTLFGIGDTTSSGSSADLMGGRFFIACSEEIEYGKISSVNATFFGNANRICTGDPIYSTHGENASNYHIPGESGIRIDGTQEGGFQVQLAYSLSDNEYVIKGNVIDIRLGLAVASITPTPEYEYYLLTRCIIADEGEDIGQGYHNFTISCYPLSSWKTSVMTHPFYLEINSKQSSTSGSGTGWDYLYAVGEEGIVKLSFMVDFWDGGSLEPGYNSGSGAYTDHWTEDLQYTRYLSDYPKIESLPLAIKLYGWSRSGIPTTKYPVDDCPTPGDLNDSFQAEFVVLHEDESEETISITSGSSGSYTFPAQTYKVTGDGSYPVILTSEGSSLVVGDKIKKANFKVISNRGATNTIHYVERMEIQGASMFVTNSSNRAWKEERVIDNDVPVTYQRLVQAGTPALRFSTKPYTSFDFKIAGKFKLTGSTSFAGVLGLGVDGNNYVVGRMSSTKVQLVKVRDGEETILAEETISDVEDEYTWIMLEHKGGLFNIRLKKETGPTIWNLPSLTYEWKEEDGDLATSEDILHVGIYGYKNNMGIRICGFDPNQSSIIGVLPGQTNLDDFPSSGTLVINGAKYTYDGKVSFEDDIKGPYQCRNTGLNYKYTNYTKAYTGNAVEFTMFEYISNSLYYNKYANKLMCMNNGFGFVLSNTDFAPFIRTSGKRVELHNRSRNFADEVEGDNFGLYQKVWLTEGFTGVSRTTTSDEAISHPEGEFALLDYDDEVLSAGFFAASGAKDVTVEDMIQMICQLSGAEAEFPGDYIHSSRTLTTSPWRVNQ